jgi:di/tricarboxylate transporter
MVLGPKLLPDRATISSILTEEERREYIVEAFVKADSDLNGKTLSETPLGRVSGVRVLEILRHGVRIQESSNTAQLKSGDRLLLALSPRAVSKAQESHGLDIRDSLGEDLGQISLSTGVIVEAVVGPDSNLVGTALADINFRQQYRLAPMAIHRRGKNLMRDFDRVELEYGDTLLLLGTTEAVDQLRSNPDLLILDRPPVVLASRRKRIPLILAVIAGVIGAATAGLMPIAAAAIVGCVILLLTKCLSTREAYDSIHWPILFLIFAMLGVGSAMEVTGTTSWLAGRLVDLTGDVIPKAWQPLALLAGVYLLTTTLTEILSNNAAAVLLATLAIGLAQSMGLDPRPFLIAIAVAASASFATPIGYQTNTYVYGVGGYRFSDFARIGIPLNLLAFVVSMVVIPIFWSF